jgi:HAD superfamily hydrolase (TIGR01490 family)
MPLRRAALFDMDRTLVRKETASLYIRQQRDAGEATWRDAARVLYWVAQYTLGVADAHDIASRALRSLAGTHETVLSARYDDLFRRYIERHVCDRGRVAIEAHREAGDVIAIVTGASPYAARPLARLLKIDHVVASELERDERGCFTGSIEDPLCYGEGKVVRAERLAKDLGFDLSDAIFYSDSFTDLPLLERVREPVIINPDPRLARVARRRGWRIEVW